jgi:hypothetical protein
VVGKLRDLARMFIDLQDKRHEADYDTSHSAHSRSGRTLRARRSPRNTWFRF